MSKSFHQLQYSPLVPGASPNTFKRVLKPDYAFSYYVVADYIAQKGWIPIMMPKRRSRQADSARKFDRLLVSRSNPGMCAEAISGSKRGERSTLE